MNKIYYNEFKEGLMSDNNEQVTYSYDKCIKLLIKQGLNEDEAIEYLDLNYADLQNNFPKFI